MAGLYPWLTMKKVDVEANREASQAANIQCMPTFKVYTGGNEKETMEGASLAGLTDMLAKYPPPINWQAEEAKGLPEEVKGQAIPIKRTIFAPAKELVDRLVA